MNTVTSHVREVFLYFCQPVRAREVKTLSMAVTTEHTGSPDRQTSPGNRTQPHPGVEKIKRNNITMT